MKLLYLPRYDRLGASSRLRFFQYLPFLEEQNFILTGAPLLNDHYVKGLYSGNVPWTQVIKGYWHRIVTLIRLKNYDAVWLEKEFLPWLPAWIELSLLPSDIPLIIDYDDAIFHQYDQHQLAIVRCLLGKKIDRLMRRANLVVAGNTYLAHRAEQAGAKQVAILPTVVDTSRYKINNSLNSRQITIGWIGSPATAHYLHLIAPALSEIVATRTVKIVAVGANANQLKGLPIATINWTEANEVEQIQTFDIGIMPLPDEPFAQGKCGYKLIQCMACGKAVVATPIGANAEIVRNGVEGFWASSQSDWVSMLLQLIDNPALRINMGNAGRERIKNAYSLNTTAAKLIKLLHSLVPPLNV